MRSHTDVDAVFVLGSVDAMKWRSCLTLFERVAAAPPLFAELIDAFYDGRRDERTRALLA